MISEEKYNQLKKKILKLEKERDQAIGAKNQIEETLKTEFKCNSIKEAEKLLSKLKKEETINAIKFRKEFKKFEQEYEKYTRLMEKPSKQ